MKKRVFSAALSCMILATMMSGCTSKESANSANGEIGKVSNISAPGVFPIVEEQVELTVVVPDATYLSDFNDNMFTKWYEEKTNVKVKYIHVPAQSKKEKINLLLASGEYPDILMSAGLTPADEINYGTQGIFLKLNDLIEEHGVELKKVFSENDSLPGQITSPDGNIYGLPNINDCFHCNNNIRAWINTDWLKALDLSMPTTTDEFYNVLKAFKENDPNGNGKADEIAMMGCNKANSPDCNPYTFLMNSFVYYDDKTNPNLELVGSKVNFVATTEEYKEGVKYIRKLFEEGLIDITSLTQPIEQFKQVGTNPDEQILGVGTAAFWWHFLGYAKDTNDERANIYEGIAPLKGPNGVQYSPITGTAVGNGAIIITDKCKNPEVAMKWVDGLYSEEVTMRSQFGIEGVNWAKAPEGAVGIDKEPAIFQLLKENEQGQSKERATNTFPGNRTSKLRLGQMTDYSILGTDMEQEPRLYSVTKENYYPYSAPEKQVPTFYLNPDEASEYSRLKAQIETYTKECLVAFLTGNRNIDTEWDTYMKEFDKLELAKYIGIVQEAYDRQYK